MNLIKEKYRLWSTTFDPINQTFKHEASAINSVFTETEEHKFADLAKPMRFGHELLIDEFSKPVEWQKTAMTIEESPGDSVSRSDSPKRRRVIKKKTNADRSGVFGVFDITPESDIQRRIPGPPRHLLGVPHSRHHIFVTRTSGTQVSALTFTEGSYVLALDHDPADGEKWKLTK